MALTPISLKVPPDVLVRLREEAHKRRTTVTGLLLAPWLDEPGETVNPPPPRPTPSPTRSATVVVQAKKRITEVVAQKRERVSAGRFVGFDPITGDKVYK